MGDCKICLIMFTFIHIFGLNFLVEIRSAVFWMQMDLNLSFRCSIQVNAFSCDAIIKGFVCSTLFPTPGLVILNFLV